MTAALRMRLMKLSSVWASTQASTCFIQPFLEFIFLPVIECERINPSFNLTFLKLAGQIGGKPAGKAAGSCLALAVLAAPGLKVKGGCLWG